MGKQWLWAPGMQGTRRLLWRATGPLLFAKCIFPGVAECPATPTPQKEGLNIPEELGAEQS